MLLYTANFYPFKMAVPYQFSQILIVQMLFPQNQQASGPDLRMVGKSLKTHVYFSYVSTITYAVVTQMIHLNETGHTKHTLKLMSQKIFKLLPSKCLSLLTI